MTATLEIDKLYLCEGVGSPDGVMCIMSAASLLAGEEFGHHPKCVAPTIRRLLITVNDRCPKEPRQRLKELLPHIIGSATRGDERLRAYALADWACRMALPMALRAAKEEGLAEKAAAIREIVDIKSATKAKKICREIQTAAAAYAAAAYATAAAGDGRHRQMCKSRERRGGVRRGL